MWERGLRPHTGRYRGLPGGLTRGGSLGLGAGPFGAGGDAGVAEDGSQEVGHERYVGWTLLPGGDRHAHKGS